jgi:hypothetical protein
MSNRVVVAALLGVACAATLLPAAEPVVVDVRSGPFRMVADPGGWTIEMEASGQLKDPGRPMLPEKELLVLLPPGARPVSLEVAPIGTERMEGEFAIAPAPAMLPLAGPARSAELMKRELEEWEAVRRAAYADDRAWPPEAARIVGSGTLRKYSYVRVAYHPFTYHAVSGRLFRHEGARIRVSYSTPKEAVAETLLRDRVADQEAADLFVNYGGLKDLYRPAPAEGAAAPSITALHDYVIITTPDNLAAVEASGFVAWKTSLGVTVRTVLTDDPLITGQPGADAAERIRNFLRANYAAWGTAYVLFVGQFDDPPMRYCYPDPDNHLHDPSNPGVGPGSVPTDLYFADLSLPDSESWDSDGDGFHGEYGQDTPDFLAEVSVGRVPTSVDARITYTLDKMVRYEQDTGMWKRNALHGGAVLFFENQNHGGGVFRDGAVTVDEIESKLMQGWTVSRYSEQAGLVTSTYPWPALDLVTWTNDWNAGMYGIVNWAGHGWPDGVARTVWTWDDGDGVPETDGSDGMDSIYFVTDYPIMEDDYPSIVCAVSCDVGYPDFNPYGNVGVHLLTEPSLGAAAGIVSSSRYAAVSGDWPAMPGGAESLCFEFNRYLIAGPGGARKVGDALYESKFFTHVNYGWDRHYEYRNQYNYNLYGDPAMEWRGAPTRTGNLLRNTEVTGLDPVTPPLADVLPLNPLDDLRVAGFVAGDVDPDPTPEARLVFYAVDAPVRIWLTRTPSGEIRIDF